MTETQVLIAARQSRLIKGRDQVSMERQDDTAVQVRYRGRRPRIRS